VILKLRIPALLGLGALAVLLWAPGRSFGAPSDIFRAGVESVIAEAGKTPERARLYRLFELHWDYLLQEFPEFATEVGVPGQNDRWTDRSAAAIARRKADLDWPVKALATIDRTKLAPEDALNYDLFKRQAEAELEGRRFPWELMPLSQLYGIQQSVPQILGEQMPARTAADYEAVLSRLRGTAALVDQTIASMKEGLRRGVTPPKITLRNVVAQVDGILVEDPATSPFLGAFRRIPETVPADRREALKAEAAQLLKAQALPAFRRLRDFLASEYVPNCRDSLAAGALPDGQDWYAYRVAQSTTTPLTPKQIHEIGLEEVKQIRTEMERLMRDTGFAGDLAAFFEFLRADPRFFFSRPEDLLAGYREIAKRADPEVIKLFGRMPRLPYGVVPMPAANAASRSAGAYDAGSLAAGRPGYFWANLSAVETRPKWEMEALVLHEAVPGHHLQIALAQEQADLPSFRRYGGYEAYGEGWALYAETLGHDMGFYTDPYSRFGALNYQMWRAVRLVVDTGIHAFGWSRQQAIDYFKANSAKPEREIVVEIDRYIASPGQALAYKIGQRKFLELRERAARELGARFDIRVFHDAVLAEGALPLDVLEARIDAWIAQRKASAASGERGRATP
jgi:uncharacterized protein (DUF885 family)